jgi:hypothetical protein
LKNEIEVTPDQATAIAAWQAANQLGSLVEAVNDISVALGAMAQSK